MKVGILTVPTSISFGASLQMYALYRAVEMLGAEAEVIHYQNEYMKAERYVIASRRSPVKRLLRKVLHHRQNAAFRGFEKCMSKYPPRAIHSPVMLTEAGKRYEAVICGSDQVWNPDITGADLSYFLDFCGPDTKRIAYAPSFGRTELPEAFQEKIQRELKRFDHLSVREAEGQHILCQLLDAEVPLVLDPSFLLTRDEWISLERKHAAATKPYILYYAIHGSESLMRFCLELAEKKHMKVVIVGGNSIRRLRNRDRRIDYACDVGPQEWLYLLHHADCVVTNSFHGTAFSVIYQKLFYVEFSSLTNSRLEHIIRTMGLQEWVVGDGCALTDAHIDYCHVEKTVRELRERSLMYLRKAVISE